MPIDTTDSLRITRVVKADRPSVWEALTQPEHMKKWMCPAPNGVKSASADVRVGGAYETEIVLLHEGFPAAEEKRGHEEGWGACLTHLVALCA